MPLLLAVFVLVLVRLAIAPFAACALATLVGLAVAPSIGPNAVAVPLVLLVLASLGRAVAPGGAGDRAGPAPARASIGR